MAYPIEEQPIEEAEQSMTFAEPAQKDPETEHKEQVISMFKRIDQSALVRVGLPSKQAVSQQSIGDLH